MFVETFRFIITDLVLNILYFPVWWYTTGTLRVLKLIRRELISFIESFRLRTLFRFMLQPMFGLTDITSRIISVGVRIVHFGILLFITMFYTVMLIALLLLWLLLPVLLVYSVLYHFDVLP